MEHRWSCCCRDLLREMIRKGALLLLAFFVFLGATLEKPSQSRAELAVDVTQGQVAPLPIAIPVFEGGTLAADITQVVEADLKRSGLFDVLDPRTFLDGTYMLHSAPDFSQWRILNAQALVIGSVHSQGNGQITAQFRLWDVFSGKEMIEGKQFTTSTQNWRRLGHIIADAIYTRLTGESGYFDSKIVFVDEKGPKNQRIKRLAVMDQDGANLRYLTDGRDLVLTPRFNPMRQEIIYMSYQADKPQVYLLNLETGQREVVGQFPGMTFAPRISPDGSSALMSLQQEGNANIYQMDLRSRRTTRLTNSLSIDTSPAFSPDGRQIVFESDRGGSQQLYVMNADGSQPHRISFGPGRYATPVWSPRGDLIAFTKYDEGRFMIGVMRPDGQGERILTDGYHNEAPAWSPNGRVLIFFRETPGAEGGPKLWTVDLTGYHEQLLATPGFASDPTWSSLLK